MNNQQSREQPLQDRDVDVTVNVVDAEDIRGALAAYFISPEGSLTEQE